MTNSVSITVHPSDLSGEYLTVSDAMRQVLDMISALEGIEAAEDSDRQIVWRLTEAHTNSPPFTVKAEPFSREPEISVIAHAKRVTHLYAIAVSSVLEGTKPDWLESEPGNALKRALKRNLNGVGHTDVIIEGESPIVIVPTSARVGVRVLEADEAKPEIDLLRTEFGSIECQVVGLTRWYSSPAIIIVERLSRAKTLCVLTPELASQIGPEHQWSEAWEGQSLRIGGKLSYDGEGVLKRVHAYFHEAIEWFDIPIADLKGLDITQGLSVTQHLDEFWGEGLA